MDYIQSIREINNPDSDEKNPSFEMLCDFICNVADERSNPFLCLDEVSWEADCWRSTETKVTKWKQRESNTMTKNRGSGTFMAKAIEEKPMCFFQNKVNVQGSRGQYPKEQERKRQICHYCSKDHDLDDCKEFAKLDGSTRYTFVKERNLSTGCLILGHKKMYCRRKRMCKVCQRYHPTTLHNSDMMGTMNQEVPKQLL